MKRIEILLKCVIIICMFWGFSVGGPLSCGSGAGGSGCACAPGEEGGLPPAFQYVIDLIRAIIYQIAPQIESGGKYIKQTFVGERCGNIISPDKLQYAGIDFTEPIDPATFSIVNNISVESIDYFSRVPVTPQLAFDNFEFQQNNTRLVLWIKKVSIRPDTIYTITFKSPVSSPVKTAKGEGITTKIYKPPSEGGGLDHEEDFTLPWTFTVRVPDGVLPYITSFGAEGVDLTKVPPHSDVLPTATFSEPMSQVAVQYEMLTPEGWVTCPCDPGLNPECNQCPGQGPLGLYRTYRTTYLSSGTYCSYATRDMSGEPLTPVPGSTTPGGVSYNYTSSKVRIEEPVAKPGEVLEIRQTNPIDFSVIATTDMNYLRILEPVGNYLRGPLSLSLSGGKKVYNGKVLLDNFLHESIIKVQAYLTTSISSPSSGNDSINVIYNPPPRGARFVLPLWCINSLAGFQLSRDTEDIPLPPGCGNVAVEIPFYKIRDIFDSLHLIDTRFFEFYIDDFYIEITDINFHFVEDSTKIGGGRIDFSVTLKMHVNSGEIDYGLIQCNLAGTEPIRGVNFSGSLSLDPRDLTLQSFYTPSGKLVSFYQFKYPYFTVNNFSAQVGTVDFICLNNVIDDAIKDALNEVLSGITDSHVTSTINPTLPEAIFENLLFLVHVPDKGVVITGSGSLLESTLGCDYANDWESYGVSIKAHYPTLNDIPFVTVKDEELSIFAPYLINLSNSTSDIVILDIWYQDCME